MGIRVDVGPLLTDYYVVLPVLYNIAFLRISYDFFIVYASPIPDVLHEITHENGKTVPRIVITPSPQ
jgi:hypothetical protein